MFDSAIHAGNGKNAADVCCDNYTTGERFMATVKAVRPEGVYIDRTGGGSGIISTACWGSGRARVEALSKIQPGDQFEVEVVSWYPLTKTLSLVLPGMSDCVRAQRPIAHSAKPQFAPIPVGSTLLIDFSNLLGGFKSEGNPASWALPLLESVETQLTAAGYGVHFFMEERTFTWISANLPDPADKKFFQKRCSRKDSVTVVCGKNTEADHPILQTAAMLPDAVCVSRDHFRDYAAAFSGIVGSERIRPFTVMRIAGHTLLSIDGIKNAVLVRRQANHASEAKTGTNMPQKPEAPVTNESTAETIPVPQQTFRNRETEIRLLSMAARKDPSKYLALADLYWSTSKAEDRKLAAKFDALGWRRAKILRERSIRAQRRRTCVAVVRNGGRRLCNACRNAG